MTKCINKGTNEWTNKWTINQTFHCTKTHNISLRERLAIIWMICTSHQKGKEQSTTNNSRGRDTCKRPPREWDLPVGKHLFCRLVPVRPVHCLWWVILLPKGYCLRDVVSEKSCLSQGTDEVTRVLQHGVVRHEIGGCRLTVCFQSNKWQSESDNSRTIWFITMNYTNR